MRKYIIAYQIDQIDHTLTIFPVGYIPRTKGNLDL